MKTCQRCGEPAFYGEYCQRCRQGQSDWEAFNRAERLREQRMAYVYWFACAVVLALIVWMLTGCVKYDHATDPDPNANAQPIQFRIVRIEGCEYLAWHVQGAESLTHKGNCTNQIHWRNLER